MAAVELDIPARPAYLSFVRLVVDAAVGSLAPGLGGARLDDLKVAVTEACSNAIEAQQAANVDRPVRILCDLSRDLVSVEIVDHGAGFDPDQVASLPAVTDPHRLRYETGLGIPLMRTLVDEVSFASSPQGTNVRLVVRPSS